MIRRPWTTAEDSRLRELYATLSAAECAVQLGRTQSSVQMRVSTLGLSKSPEWIAERTRQRWAEGRHENSRAKQFRRGGNPMNKGRPQSEWMSAESIKRTMATRFKPGHLGGKAAEKVQPIGALRVTRDGQLQRKVNNDLPLQRRWVAVARLVWEAANGPVPTGHVVRFKDGRQRHDPAEITADVLECVTRAENMRRNSYHTNLPPEVARLVQLRGALNRKINNRTRRHEEQGQ